MTLENPRHTCRHVHAARRLLRVAALAVVPLMTACGGAPSDPLPSSSGGASGATSVSTSAASLKEILAAADISRFDLKQFHGKRDPRSGYGHIVGIGTITTNRPVMLDLKVELLDASGRTVLKNTGLNSHYAVGTQDLVTINRIDIPNGTQVNSYRMTLIGADNLGSGFIITKISKPTISAYSQIDGIRALRGTITFTGNINTSPEAQGVCTRADGTFFYGSDNLSDNPVRGGAGDAHTVDYEIPLKDARAADLSTATCRVSA